MTIKPQLKQQTNYHKVQSLMSYVIYTKVDVNKHIEFDSEFELRA